MKHKERLDVLLVARNLAESRSKAQAMIMAGEVYVNEQKADKAGLEVNIDEDPVIEVRGSACPYVSRGGLKLEKALRDFGVDPTGFVCSDSGASTGGFTDCPAAAGGQQGLRHRRRLRPAGVEDPLRPPRRRDGADQHPLCHAGGSR